MKSKRLVAASAATLLSLGMVAAPAASAFAAPPGHSHGHSHVVGNLNVDKATWRQAKLELRVALAAAHKKFHVDTRAARVTVRADTADERAVVRPVLRDDTATNEQKGAAWQQFLTDTADERALRKEAYMTAKKTWQASRIAAWKAFRLAVTS